jgi:N-acetylglucosaminyldiphosphoundecaprenol N-acetyl-beta-D-mannosaminyltransferase
MRILNISNIKFGGLDDILTFCRNKLNEGKGAFLIPMNPIKVIKAREHRDFQEIIDNADWVFPDAWGMKWAASVLYRENITLSPGYRVMFSLLKQAEENKHSVYLLGTTDEILSIALIRLKEMYPMLKIVGTHNGFFSSDEEEEIFRKIVVSEPDYVFVAMGEYKQEKIIKRLNSVYPRAIYLGVGGSIDLIAGRQPSPPEWVRRNHLEWLYRFIRQPFRAPRFKALPIFVWLVILEKIVFTIKNLKLGKK